MPTETQKVFFPTIEDFAQFRVDLFRAEECKPVLFWLVAKVKTLFEFEI
jgi:hypothetical protein